MFEFFRLSEVASVKFGLSPLRLMGAGYVILFSLLAMLNFWIPQFYGNEMAFDFWFGIANRAGGLATGLLVAGGLWASARLIRNEYYDLGD